MKNVMKSIMPVLGLSLALSVSANAQGGQKIAPSTMVISSARPVTIVLPTTSILPEETAAEEVRDYLSRITGANCTVVREDKIGDKPGQSIYIGATKFAARYLADKKAFADEEWAMQTLGNALILTGGKPRGTLYGAYRFLEDVGGVRWWNPWEETVPPRKSLTIPTLKRRGQPAINYRDIYAIYGGDNGRFSARSRLDREGYAPIAAKYGGSRDYGPPSHAQNFYEYIEPAKYYKEHPDWYLIDAGRILMSNGAVTDTTGQLNLGNKEMRKEFLRLLLINIRNARKAAIEKKLPPPDVFGISQNDGGSTFVGPEDKEMVKREGSDAAAIVDFVNYLADGIREEFPSVYIDTLAYNQSEIAPKTLKPRDNVIIRLADTQSNLLLPVTAERNRVFRNNLENWSKLAKNLRIWDYDITFTNFNMNLPTPTIGTYAPDLQFFQKNHVTGMFIEFEEPVLADMRDLKIWVLTRLMEDPKQNTDKLVAEFTNGFYGPAAPSVRQYLDALNKAVDQTTAKTGVPEVAWFASLAQFNYLTLDFLQSADKIFDKGAAAVAKDEVLSRRLRHARFSLDNAIMMRYARLIGDWVRSGHTAESFPLNADVTSKRLLQTWSEQIEIRMTETEKKTLLEKAKQQVEALVAAARYVPLPAVFNGIPPEKIFTYGFADSKVYGETFSDPEAPSLYVRKLPIDDHVVDKFKMPTSWGVYADVETKTLTQGTIKVEDVTGPGYNWYKLGTVKPTKSSYVFFTWSWMLQFVIGDTVDEKKPGGEVELWANLKFEGPLFPHGGDKTKNALLLDRIVAVKR